MRRLDEKPPAKAPAPAARRLPEDIESALTRLEKADWAKLGDAAPQVMHRLQRIAAKLRR
jgi:hypothetical protein